MSDTSKPVQYRCNAFADVQWWEVIIPFREPERPRWKQVHKYVQADTAEQAISIAKRMLRDGIELGDNPTADKIANPYLHLPTVPPGMRADGTPKRVKVKAE